MTFINWAVYYLLSLFPVLMVARLLNFCLKYWGMLTPWLYHYFFLHGYPFHCWCYWKSSNEVISVIWHSFLSVLFKHPSTRFKEMWSLLRHTGFICLKSFMSCSWSLNSVCIIYNLRKNTSLTLQDFFNQTLFIIY